MGAERREETALPDRPVARLLERRGARRGAHAHGRAGPRQDRAVRARRSRVARGACPLRNCRRRFTRQGV